MGNFRTYINPWLGEMLEQLHLNIDFTRGEGSYLYAGDKRYLDCVSAYGALPFGHNPQEIWAALTEAKAQSRPNFIQPSALEPAAALARRLIELAPGLDYVTFTNSGAEAVEAAIKLCRAATGRMDILATNNSFHGKTLAALSATGKESYQQAFGAPIEGFSYVEFGNSQALEACFAQRAAQLAAFIIEPIQGEGGVIIPPPGYLKAVRRLCDQYKVPLVVDEIQTGLGRTGSMFVCASENISPDLLLIAKALGGGLMPIGAVLSKASMYSQEFGLKHSSTFAGGSLVCYAGIASLDMLTRDNFALLDNVQTMGKFLLAQLENLCKPYEFVSVRGRGLMLALEFNIDRFSHPHSLTANLGEQQLLAPIISSYLLNREQVRVAPTLNGAHVVRIQPPLNICRAEALELLAAWERVLPLIDQGDTGALLSHLLGDGEVARLERKRVPKADIQEKDKETKFAFLLHPLAAHSFQEYDPSLRCLNAKQVNELVDVWQPEMAPFVISQARISSATGASARCDFISIPRTARQFMEMQPDDSLALIRRGIELAQDRGAQLVGLGAFTSVVSWGGMRLRNMGVPLTTGNSYTVATAGEAVIKALAKLKVNPALATAAVLGATGSIGNCVSHLLAESMNQLILVGNPANPLRSRQRLAQVAGAVCRHVLDTAKSSPMAKALTGLNPPPAGAQASEFGEFFTHNASRIPISISTDADHSLPRADVVVTATSSVSELVTPDNVRFGAVVCDLSRPANVSLEIKGLRPDVLVIDGGVVELWGRPDLGWNFGFETGLGYACMAETMLLALEGHLQHTSIGSDIPMKTVTLLRNLAQKHGFRVADLRSFDKPLAQEDWERVLASRSHSKQKVN